MDRIIRFHFEDHGQDCLWWDVQDNGKGVGKIIDANIQNWLWADGKKYVNLLTPHEVHDCLAFTDDLMRSMETGYCLIFNYPVARIDDMTPAGVA